MFAGMQDGSRMRVPISPEGFIPGPGIAGQTRFADQLPWCLNERGEVYAHGRWGPTQPLPRATTSHAYRASRRSCETPIT